MQAVSSSVPAGYNGFNARFDFALLSLNPKSAAYLQQKREELERNKLVAISEGYSRAEYTRYTRGTVEMTRGAVTDTSRSPPREQHNRSLVPVEFSWPYEGEKVFVTGSFNNWKEIIPLDRDSDEWKHTLKLHPGVYMFKFVVDGRWCYDMKRESTRDAEGNVNNIIRVVAHTSASVSH